MNKFLLVLVVLMVIPCLLACLASSRGIIEGEGFRMVRNGQTLWEMMPTEDGGVTVRFHSGGKDVCAMSFGEKLVGSKCSIGSTEWHVVLRDGTYGNSVSVDNGKAVMNRVIRSEKKGEYYCADVLSTPTSEINVRVTPEMAWSKIRAGLGQAMIELSDKEASVSGRARNDVNLNLEVGSSFTCLGKLLDGFVVRMANRHGKWSWANNK